MPYNQRLYLDISRTSIISIAPIVESWSSIQKGYNSLNLETSYFLDPPRVQCPYYLSRMGSLVRGIAALISACP